MDWKLEVVVVPVAEVERAKRFYSQQVGFGVDHDTRINDTMRIVQLTPPGSACSIVIGTGIVEMPHTGLYRHGFPASEKRLKLKISRADVADLMLKQLTDNTYLHQSPGLSY